MQKLFTSCYELDQKCYETYHLTEDILMEHAASAMEKFIRKNFSFQSKIFIVAGAGNNGADGITLARLLQNDFDVKLFLPFGAKSKMAKLQLKRTQALDVAIVDSIEPSEIFVDALFGAGLNRDLNEKAIAIIEQLNKEDGFKLACDIPSGIDAKGALRPIAFKADYTITMGALKEALFSDLAKDYVGEIEVANLGVARKLYEDESSSYLLEKIDFTPPLRKNFNTHKGNFGHVAIFSGEKEGAALLSAMAASRFGAGLCTLVYHEKITHPPFLMSSSNLPKNTTAIAIGMGLGSFFDDDFLQKNVINSTIPIVLDADSFYKENLLSILQQSNRKIVLTPHPKEFASMLHILQNKNLTTAQVQEDRINLAKSFSKSYPNVVLLLKGANPIIAQNGVIYINPLGKNNLSKGGNGDVLSGLIAALLAQGYDALKAAINGSLALALLSQKYQGSNFSLLPTDLIELLKELR